MTTIKDRFRMQVVVDPVTNSPIEGATFTVYDAADTGLTISLTVTDMTDIPMTLTSGPLGIIPDFQVVGHTQVLVVSADGTVTPLDSMLSFLLSVLPDPTLLDDGFTLTTSGGAWAAQTPVGASLRQDVTITTATLATYARETGTVTMMPSYALVTVTVDRPCRLRLYDSTAHRDSDVGRARGTDPDPTANVGLMCDIAFVAAGPRTMSPSVFGAVVPYGYDVPYTVDNLDSTGAAVVHLTLTYMRIEQ